MSAYLPAGCTQDQIDRYQGPEPEPEEPETLVHDDGAFGFFDGDEEDGVCPF